MQLFANSDVLATDEMSPSHDPIHLALPSEQQAGALEATLMFSRTTIRTVYVGTSAIGVGLILWAMLSRSALLTPVDPDVRAIMIGLGVFLGVLVAVIEREAWLLGFGGRRAPKGAFVAVGMLALIGASGFGGNFLAAKLWEWHSFHGLHPARVDRDFTIVSRSSGRSGSALALRDSVSGKTFSISCSDAMVGASQDGDRLILPVETGRGGVQRVMLPTLRDIYRR